MTNDVYKAPSAELVSADDIEQSPYFIVSKRKLWVMSMVTLGLYFYVWFYMHWRIIKHSDERVAHIWPVARCIFSIFFVHSLFRRFDRSAASSGSSSVWSPGTNATIYVIVMLGAMLIDFIPAVENSAILTFLNIVLPIAIATVTLSNAQTLANIANADTQGDGNSNFTAVNIAWLILGSLLWALFIFGTIYGY